MKQRDKSHKVYLLRIGPYKYIGITTNSLKKRLWQHKVSGQSLAKLLKDHKGDISIDLLMSVNSRETALVVKRNMEEMYTPDLNLMLKAKRSDKAQRQPKRGKIVYDGYTYKTKYELWKELGKTKYGTFKSRLFRYPGDYKHALGLEPTELV